jgi:hypothetical protein
MSKKVIMLIEKFISEVKGRYPRLIIGYDYCSETEEYNIWHIDSKLQFKDEDFIKFVGRLMKEILLDNNVFDFSFGYDHLKAKTLLARYNYHVSYNVEVDASFVSNMAGKTDFYYPNSDSVKLDDIKTSFILARNNRLNSFNVFNDKNNLSSGLEQCFIYNDKQEERLVA